MFDMNTPDDEASRFDDMFDVFGSSSATDVDEDDLMPQSGTEADDQPASSVNGPQVTTGINLTGSVIAASVVAAVVDAVSANSSLPNSTVQTTSVTSASASPASTPAVSGKMAELNDVTNPSVPSSREDVATKPQRFGPSRWVAAGIIAGVAFASVSGNLPGISSLTGVDTVDAVAPQMLTTESEAVQVADSAGTIPGEVRSVFTAQILNANRYFEVTGSYSGWRPEAPMIGASGGPYLVLVLAAGGVCFSTGIAPGYDDDVTIDPTGLRCDLGSINDLQSKLDTIG